MTTNTDANRVILSGKLSKIEIGLTAQNFPFANIIITSIGLKYTENVPCVVYGDTVSHVRELAVGDSIMVQGRLRVKEAKDRDGNDRAFITMVISRIKKQ